MVRLLLIAETTLICKVQHFLYRRWACRQEPARKTLNVTADTLMTSWLWWIMAQMHIKTFSICSGVRSVTSMSVDRDRGLAFHTHSHRVMLGTNPPPSNFPPSVSSKLNLHNWGWSCFPFGLHNSWGPWQLLDHWLAITHGTPLWPHPWDPWDGETKAGKGQGYKEPVWPPQTHLRAHNGPWRVKPAAVVFAALLRYNAGEALEGLTCVALASGLGCFSYCNINCVFRDLCEL